jgi:hypothetical protein
MGYVPAAQWKPLWFLGTVSLPISISFLSTTGTTNRGIRTRTVHYRGQEQAAVACIGTIENTSKRKGKGKLVTA